MKVVMLLVLMVVVCRALPAQNAEWARLGALPPGTNVAVTTTHSAPCLLEGFTEEGIQCGYRGRLYWVDRARIVRVTLEKRSHAVAVGTAVGAAAGGALVAGRMGGNASTKAIPVLVGMGLAGWLGYGIGHLVPPAERAVIYDGGRGGP